MPAWEIDGEKSGMENLFSAARYATLAFKARAVKNGLNLTNAEWDDAIDEVVLAAVRRFMYRLRNGSYSKNHSFYLNVWGCVLSCFHNTMQSYLNRFVKPKMCSVDRMDTEKAQSLIDTSSRPMYVSTNSDRKIAESNLKSWLSKCEHLSHLQSEWEWDYFMYVESCEATGMPVNKMNPMYILGAPYATGEVIKGVKMILIREETIEGAVMGKLFVGGIMLCSTLENEKTIIPTGTYKLNVSRSPKFERMLPLVYNEKVSMMRGIRIHAGNSAKDSSGCILVGERVGNKLKNSRPLEQAITEIARHDATLEITQR
jgi:hypothetical protein